jgi:regulator of replication initiation timing
MKCGNTIVLVLVGVAIFGCSTHPIGVDFKKQHERYVSEEVVLNLVSYNKKLSQKVSVLESDYSLLKEQLENQIENNKNLEQRLDGMFDRLLSDSQHKVATGTTEDAYTDPLFNRTRNNTDFFNKRVDNKRGIVL